jgi:hypothetical protein
MTLSDGDKKSWLTKFTKGTADWFTGTVRIDPLSKRRGMVTRN